MSNCLALYRWFNEGHELLYIGISSSIGSRVKAHSKFSNWFVESAYMTVEWAKTPEELSQKERLAIRKERPLYNISHNEKPRRKAFSTAVTQRETILLATLETLFAKQDAATYTISLLEAQLQNALLEKELFELQAQRAELLYRSEQAASRFERTQRLFIVSAK